MSIQTLLSCHLPHCPWSHHIPETHSVLDIIRRRLIELIGAADTCPEVVTKVSTLQWPRLLETFFHYYYLNLFRITAYQFKIINLKQWLGFAGEVTTKMICRLARCNSCLWSSRSAAVWSVCSTRTGRFSSNRSNSTRNINRKNRSRRKTRKSSRELISSIQKCNKLTRNWL